MIGLSLSLGGGRMAKAHTPAAFGPLDWTLDDAGDGGTLILRLLRLPDSDLPVEFVEHRVEGGAWTSTMAAAPDEIRIAGLAVDAPATVELRAVSLAGPGPIATSAATPAAGGIGDQIIRFGALTAPGAGRARLVVAEPVESIEITGQGDGAGLLAVVGDGLALTGAPVHGAQAELLINGDTRITATIETIPGARSVATLDELNAALLASSHGQKVLLRGGDYGRARDAIVTQTRVGPSSGLWSPAGSAASGPVVVRPHDGEAPRIWQLNFGRITDVEFRDLAGFCEPEPAGVAFSGAQKAVFLGADTGGLCGARVTLRRCTVTGTDVARPEDGRRLPSGIKLQGRWDACSLIDCVVDNVYDGIGIPGGENARVEGCVVRNPWNDGVKSGGAFSGLRFLFNVVEKSVKYGARTDVASLRFFAPVGGAAPAAGTAAADFTRGRLRVTLAAGQAATFAAEFSARDGRYGFGAIPATGGLKQALGLITAQRNPGDAHAYKTYVDFRPGALIYAGGDTLDFEYDVAAATAAGVDVAALIAAGEIATPGMVLEASTAHADFLQITANTSDAVDAHVIGNVFYSEGENLTGARVDNGMMMGAQTDIWWRDCLFAGNIVSQSGRNGMNVKRHDDCFVAFNTLIADPLDPDWIAKNFSASSCTVQYDHQTSDDSAANAAWRGYVGRCITESVAVGDPPSAIDLGDNYTLTPADRAVASALAWAAGNFVDFPGYGTRKVADPFDLFRPLPDSPLRFYGAHARPDLIDHTARTYDAAGLRAAGDALLAPPALRDGAARPLDSGSAEVTVTTSKGVGALHVMTTASATPPESAVLTTEGAATPLTAPYLAGPATARLAGLAPGTTYRVWVVQSDALGQMSETIDAGAITTPGLSTPLAWLGGYRTPEGPSGSTSTVVAPGLPAAQGLVFLALAVRGGNTGRSVSAYAVQPRDGDGSAIGLALTPQLCVATAATGRRAVAMVHAIQMPPGAVSADVTIGFSGSVRAAIDLFATRPDLGYADGVAATTSGGTVSAARALSGEAMLLVAAAEGAAPGGAIAFGAGEPPRPTLDLNGAAGQLAGVGLHPGVAPASASAEGGATEMALAAIAVRTI